MKVSVKSTASIGTAIRLTRLSQGLDQMSMASLTSSAQSFISHVENGKETAQIGKVLALLDALGIGVELSLPDDVNRYMNEHLTSFNKYAVDILGRDSKGKPIIVEIDSVKKERATYDKSFFNSVITKSSTEQVGQSNVTRPAPDADSIFKRLIGINTKRVK